MAPQRSALVLSILLVPVLLAGCSGTDYDNTAIHEAFRNGDTGVWVTGSGEVLRTVADDTRGGRHQRFEVDLGDNHRVLITHLIEGRERVPLAAGDRVAFKGVYEWRASGGVIGDTHGGDGETGGGWIEYQGERYQ